jgi:arginyl-tRNA synthetase
LIYVVGSEQKLHFKQLKAVIKKLGYDWYKDIYHIDFGLFRFSGEKMSTRKGKVIFMEDVLNEASETILKIIEEKNPDLEEKERVAEEVGAGAIIFGDLVNERIKNITFSWEKMLQFEGDTGPYIQYAHARCRSILRKGEINENPELFIPENIDKYERELLREVLIYSVKINKSIEAYKPHYIAESLLQITKVFNRFYQNCPVLSADGDTKKFRLLLVYLTATVLKSGMGLLGMRAPNKM